MKVNSKTKDTYRFFFTFLKGWLFIAGMLLGFVVFIYLLGLSLKNYGIFLSYYILGVLITLILFAGLGIMLINFVLKQCSLRKIKEYSYIKDPEVVVVLGYDGPKIIGNLFISTYLGIGYLIKYLELKKKSFNIYITPSKKKISNLLNNRNIKIFYFVGHGSKRGFSLNKKENIFYSDYLGSKLSKEEVHLYHCGHSEGKTLIDYIVKEENRKKCFVANDKVMVIAYILKFYDLYKTELQKHKKEASQ
jgi:uncharacterized membrane protein YhdT